jgi:hypothetical protein
MVKMEDHVEEKLTGDGINKAIDRALKMSKQDKVYISMGAVIDLIMTAKINFNEIDKGEIKLSDLLNLLSVVSEFKDDIREVRYGKPVSR